MISNRSLVLRRSRLDFNLITSPMIASRLLCDPCRIRSISCEMSFKRPERLMAKVLSAGGVKFFPQFAQIGQVGLNLLGRGEAVFTQEVGKQILDWCCQLKRWRWHRESAR